MISVQTTGHLWKKKKNKKTKPRQHLFLNAGFGVAGDDPNQPRYTKRPPGLGQRTTKLATGPDGGPEAGEQRRYVQSSVSVGRSCRGEHLARCLAPAVAHCVMKAPER